MCADRHAELVEQCLDFVCRLAVRLNFLSHQSAHKRILEGFALAPANFRHCYSALSDCILSPGDFLPLRRNTIKNKQYRDAGELADIYRGINCVQIDNARLHWRDNDIRHLSRLCSSAVCLRGGVNDNEVVCLGLGCLDRPIKPPRRLGCDVRRVIAAPVHDFCRGRLCVNVNEECFQPSAVSLDGEMDSHRCLSRTTLLANERYYEHSASQNGHAIMHTCAPVGKCPLSFYDWNIFLRLEHQGRDVRQRSSE